MSIKYGDMSMSITENPKLCKLSDRIRLNLITIGYATVDSQWSGEVLSPVYSRLYYVVSGEAVILPKNSVSITFKPGHWYLLPSGCSFEYTCKDKLEHYFFHLKLCDFDETDLLRECNKPLCIKAASNRTDMENYIHSTNPMDGLYLKQTAFSVLLEFLKEYNIDIRTDNYSPCVLSAIKYIKDNLSVKLTISEISENVFVSKSTLTKHFKKELDMSVNEYVYNLVMSGAEYMLTASDVPIHTISENFGFYDQFYFSKRFKEKFGFSPQMYRKNKV